MYKPLPDNITIKTSQIDGLGLFASKFIPKNTDLGMTHIYDERFPDDYIRLPLGGFFNHSESPNCEVLEEIIPFKHLRLRTISDINEGEEITATYTLYTPLSKTTFF